jgi:hypothetical protein
MHDEQMIEWMLLVTGSSLEVAAAHYNPATGRVDSVLPGKRKIVAPADYQRLRPWLRYENALFLNIDLVRGSSGKRPKSPYSFPACHNPRKIGLQAANVALVMGWYWHGRFLGS